MTSMQNPVPSLRYSYAEGTIPDFNYEFAISGYTSPYAYFTVAGQEYSVNVDEVWESTDPLRMLNVAFIVYADETHLVIGMEGFVLIPIVDGQFTTPSEEDMGGEGSISCVDGEVTLTFVDINDPSVTHNIPLGAPSWCYYADSEGDQGAYQQAQYENGLYYSPTQPSVSFTIYENELQPQPDETVVIIYNGYYSIYRDPSNPDELTGYAELHSTVTDGKLTGQYWEIGGKQYPVGLSILPITVEAEDSSTYFTIPVIYDPATRRITLAEGTSQYGGATTDINSVKLSFTGIVPDGTDFKARVDFNVQVRTDAHTYNHPFVLLEQNGAGWSAVIPAAVLAATEHTNHRLQFQLVLANDDYVINSRNSISLEVTQGINADSSEVPYVEIPDWDVPDGQVPYYEDIHVVELNYDPTTRMLSLVNEESKYGGSTIDTNSVAVVIYWGGDDSPVEPSQPVMVTTKGLTKASYDYNDFRARLDFAVPVIVETGVAVKPFVPLIDPRYQPDDGGGGDVQERSVKGLGSMGSPEFILYAIIPQPVLMAARELKKLPFQLVIREGDIVINSRNTITLDITRAINAMHSISTVYAPYVMYRDDSWGWLENFTYSEGAVVTYEGEVYVSLVDNNKGNNPGEDDGTYWHSLEQADTAPTFYYVSSWEEYDELESVAKVGDYLNIYYSDDGDFTDEWYILNSDHYWSCLSSTHLNGYAYTSFPSFYAPEYSGEPNQIVVSQGYDNSPIHKTVARSFYANFASNSTYKIKLYSKNGSYYNSFIDTESSNISCTFYDSQTMERIMLPYTVNTDRTVNGKEYKSVTVTCNIPTQIRMDVSSLPSLGGVY